MNIYVLGVNYKRTPLALREKLSFTLEEHPTTLESIQRLSGVIECSLLSTCNRTEIHYYATHLDTGALERYWCELKKLDLDDMKKYFYFYQGPQAVKHIFKVAAGMDSMIIGEDQVLGQFKKAYEIALQVNATGPVLNALSRQAITAAKKIKNLINEKKNHHSLASLVLERLSDFYSDQLRDKKILVIGAGQIGSMLIEQLSALSVRKLYTTRRNASAFDLQPHKEENIEVIDYESRYSVVEACDIVISATSSPHYTITKDRLLEQIKDDHKDRFFIDLAVPRDFDENIEELENINYLTIDAFSLEEDQYFLKGNVNADYVDAVLENCVLTYEKWYNFREVVPVVVEIQGYAKEIILERMESILSPMENLNSDNQELLKLTTGNALRTVLNQLLYSAGDYIEPEKLPAYFGAMKQALESLKKGD